MNQLKFGKDALVLSIITLLTVLCWVGFEVYRAYTQTTIPQVIRELARPLDPNIDIALIEDIAEKHQPSDEELNIPIVPLPSPTPELEVELEVEEESTPSQTATQSGSLE